MVPTQRLGVRSGPGETRRTGPATAAGPCYLTVTAGGLFAQVVVREGLIVPRVIEALMLLAGLCYVVETDSMIVSPDFWERINPAVLLAKGIAEPGEPSTARR